MATVRRLDAVDTIDLQVVLDLIRSEFAFMDGIIDPPSSMHRLTLDDLARGPGEVWVVGSPPIACIIMTPKTDALYVGKVTVASSERGRGLARLLLEAAEDRARQLGLATLELQTRVEMEQNQRMFIAMGFVETQRTPHPGYDRPTSITYRRPVVVDPNENQG